MNDRYQGPPAKVRCDIASPHRHSATATAIATATAMVLRIIVWLALEVTHPLTHHISNIFEKKKDYRLCPRDSMPKCTTIAYRSASASSTYSLQHPSPCIRRHRPLPPIMPSPQPHRCRTRLRTVSFLFLSEWGTPPFFLLSGWYLKSYKAK